MQPTLLVTMHATVQESGVVSVSMEPFDHGYLVTTRVLHSTTTFGRTRHNMYINFVSIINVFSFKSMGHCPALYGVAYQIWFLQKGVNVAGLKDGVAVLYICGKLMQWMQAC
jgi:hypothetical protein